MARSTTDKDPAILKAFVNWCIALQLAVSNPVRRVKLFHENNALALSDSRGIRRLIEAVRAMKARANKPSPYLEEKIVLAAHTGLRRGTLFDLQWDQIDLANSVMQIPRTKSGRPLSVPLNAAAKGTLEKLSKEREPENPYVFPHKLGKNAGEPVHDVKNGLHAALELAGIEGFTWHDLRHTFGSWLMMRGASLRSVAELLVPDFVKKVGSSAWIRTRNPPVNSRMLYR